MLQNHLNKIKTINLGAFYTPKSIVDLTYTIIGKHINIKDFIILDSSCGYGSFLNINHNNLIGCDIDELALKENNSTNNLFHINSLFNLTRGKIKIKNNDKLLIIGNPPYNDYTSQIRKNIKNKLDYICHVDLQSRDLGISFLKSYQKLNADYICVLHPLSYLIKKTNFNSLKQFKDNYILKDGIIISSKHFTFNNKEFPIIIAFYEKNENGMTFEYINKYKFKTMNNKTFSLDNFDFIYNYVNKYPKKNTNGKKIEGYFYTLRDINALARNKTFISSPINNAIPIFKEQLPYYYYIDVFKKYIHMLPYWIGNLDVFINNNDFIKNSDYFKEYSIKGIKHKNIDFYFNKLFDGII